MKSFIGRGSVISNQHILTIDALTGYKNLNWMLPEIGKKISIVSYYNNPYTYSKHTGIVKSNSNGITLNYPVKIVQVVENNLKQDSIISPKWMDDGDFNVPLPGNYTNVWNYEFIAGKRYFTKKRKGRSRRVVR